MTLRGRALLDYYDQARAQGKDNATIATELGYKYKTLEGYLYLARKSAGLVKKRRDDLFGSEIGHAFELAGDWCIVGDVHAPFTDYDFALLPALVSQSYLKHPRRLLIAGDFYDFTNFSHYVNFVAPPAWDTEKKAARHLLEVWLDTFDEIRIITGNHERRAAKVNEVLGLSDLEDWTGHSDRVHWNYFGWCNITSGGKTWRVTHQKNYSIDPLKVANDLAWKFNCNIISLHEHHVGVTLDRYGRNVIVNAGCLVDPAKLAYVQLEDSKSAAMAKGFALLRDGYPYLFAEGITDWSKWI